MNQEPIISLVHDLDEKQGTYFAQMTVSGFKTAAEAEMCVNIIHKMFCGQEVAQVKS
jgi:hypothetical protein